MMKTKTLLILSIAANIVLAGVLVLKTYQEPMAELENEELVNFDDEFYSEAKSQRLSAQSLLIETFPETDSIHTNTLAYEKTLDKTEKNAKEWIAVKDYMNNLMMIDYRLEPIKMWKSSKDCQPIKDKRKFKIELGELIITFKGDKPISIKGLNITRESVDSLLAEVFVYDKALSNICKTLNRLAAPTTPEERTFILALMDKQQNIIESYTAFKIAVSKCKTEEEIKKTVDANKAQTVEIKKEL